MPTQPHTLSVLHAFLRDSDEVAVNLQGPVSTRSPILTRTFGALEDGAEFLLRDDVVVTVDDIHGHGLDGSVLLLHTRGMIVRVERTVAARVGLLVLMTHVPGREVSLEVPGQDEARERVLGAYRERVGHLEHDETPSRVTLVRVVVPRSLAQDAEELHRALREEHAQGGLDVSRRDGSVQVLRDTLLNGYRFVERQKYATQELVRVHSFETGEAARAQSD
ncbi:hypothetical protein [Deinococcus pimensis]|uniref:hypothetical protein n=1 Tax=Deinococcus pimensis TaxID=309888 RepID=UPI000487C4C1|nr:hypothetical protein [Deinococcus pimensis]